MDIIPTMSRQPNGGIDLSRIYIERVKQMNFVFFVIYLAILIKLGYHFLDWEKEGGGILVYIDGAM